MFKKIIIAPLGLVREASSVIGERIRTTSLGTNRTNEDKGRFYYFPEF